MDPVNRECERDFVHMKTWLRTESAMAFQLTSGLLQVCSMILVCDGLQSRVQTSGACAWRVTHQRILCEAGFFPTFGTAAPVRESSLLGQTHACPFALSLSARF